jgi:hypothetical protein
VKLHGPRLRCTVTSILLLATAIAALSCDVSGPGDDCISNPAPVFTHMFTDLSLVQSIVPLGNSSGGAIKERHQVQVLTDTTPADATSGRSVPIIAPAAARMKAVRRFRTTQPFVDDYYGFELQISCEVTARFDHVRMPGDKLSAAVGGYTNGFVDPERSTSFAAGETIAYTDGNPPAPAGVNSAFAFDYALYDSRHENTFANMNRYRGTPDLALSLRAVCGGSYYQGGLRSAFNAKLGYAGNSANGDCRSASRDVPGSLAGGWFRVGRSINDDGGRLAFATEAGGVARLTISYSTFFFFRPYHATGTVNRDPALATGTTPWCHTDNSSEVWLQLSADGMRMSMEQRTGTCTSAAPSSYAMQWER